MIAQWMPDCLEKIPDHDGKIAQLKVWRNSAMITDEDVQAFKEIMQKDEEEKRNKEILKNHPYSKWYVPKEDCWKTYLPDDTKKSGRKQCQCKTEEGLNKRIIDFHKQKDEAEQKEAYNPTIKEIYDTWVCDKLRRDEIRQSTKDRYDRQYNECMSEFGKRKIKSIKEYEIEDFILDAIPEHSLTEKGYHNLITLINGIFRRAKKRGYINFSITELIEDMELSRKAFRVVEYEDWELVFSQDEEDKVFAYMEKTGWDNINLGIALLFNSGLRPGELAALKKEDLGTFYVNVDKTEIRYNDTDGKSVYEVINATKTKEGTRKVAIKNNALWILDKLKELSVNDGEWLFQRNGERLKTYIFSQRLETICNKVEITNKSLNKIRKTYATKLMDAGVPATVVQKQMGHVNISTTQKHYVKNRRNLEERAEILNNVVGI